MIKCILLITLVTIILAQDNPINAVQYLGCGMDAKTGEFGLAPLFKYSYSGKKWISPINKTINVVPDQIIISNNDLVREIVLQGSYKSYYEFLETYVSWYSFDIGISGESFSAGFMYNKELGYVYKYFEQSELTLLHGNHWWIFYTGTLYPGDLLELDVMFERELEMLPDQIHNQVDYEKYQQLVNTFGTHYPSRALFGAKLDFNTFATNQIIQQYSYQWVTEQYGLYFHYDLYDVSAGGFTNRSEITLSEQFLKEVNADTSFYGGNPSLADLNNLGPWSQTIDQYAYPINATLNGIWELVTNQTKQNTLKTFILNYIKGGNHQTLLSIPHQPISGISYLGSGFDTNLLIGGLAPLFDFTYHNGNSYPDQVFITNTPDSLVLNLNITMTDTFDGTAWEDFFYQSSYGFMGLGSKTKEIYKFYHNNYIGHQSLIKNWLYISYLTATLPLLPPPKLHPVLITELSKLPRIYDTTNLTCQHLYFDFLATFGNAFPDEIVLGGNFYFDLWYDNIFISEESIEWIKENAHWSFMGIIGNGHGSSYSYSQVDKDFKATIECQYGYIGGDNVNYDANQYKVWLNSVKNNMQPVKYHLQPIDLLIDDKIIAANIRNASRDYVKLSVTQLTDYINGINHI